jgi:hypothetical protein
VWGRGGAGRWARADVIDTRKKLVWEEEEGKIREGDSWKRLAAKDLNIYFVFTC